MTILEDERPALVKSPIVHLFIHGRAVCTLLLWVVFFCSLFVFYLLTGWPVEPHKHYYVENNSEIMLLSQRLRGAL